MGRRASASGCGVDVAVAFENLLLLQHRRWATVESTLRALSTHKPEGFRPNGATSTQSFRERLPVTPRPCKLCSDSPGPVQEYAGVAAVLSARYAL